MPKAKIRIGGQWVELGGSGDVTREEMLDEIQQAVQELEEKLNNAEEYISGSFKDGVINIIEAKKIKGFLNELDLAKKQYDQQYNEIYNNPKLAGTPDQTNLAEAKADADAAYNDLINTINNVIADNKASADEVASVDAKFTAFNDQVSLLTLMLERAKDTIAANHASTARDEAKAYADSITADLQNQINSLNTYVDTAFKDGIIYDAEYRKLESYLNTLAAAKAEFDQRYNELHSKSELSSTIKTNLETAKANYDTAYNNLIQSINNAIADQKATPEETADVDAKFNVYKNELSVLAAVMEEAVYDIQKGYTNGTLNQTNTAQLLKNSTFQGFNASQTPDKRLPYWTYVGDGWSYDTSLAFESYPTLKLNVTNGAANDLFSNYVPCSEGKFFTFSVYVYTDDYTTFSNSTCKIGLYWYTSDYTQVGTPYELSIIPSVNGQWQRYYVTAQVPTGLNISYLRAGIHSTGNGRLWISKPMLQQSPVPTEYQDESINFDTNDETSTGRRAVISPSEIGFDQIYVGPIYSDYVVTKNPFQPPTYYVDPINGYDGNDGLSSTTPKKTVQAVIDNIPKFVTTPVVIQVLGSSISFFEDLSFVGFIGQEIALDLGGTTNVMEGTIRIVGCTSLINLRNGRISYPNRTIANDPVIQYYNSGGILYNVQIYGRNKATYCLQGVYGSRVRVRDSSFYDATHGFNLQNASIGHMQNCSGNYLTYWGSVYGGYMMCIGTMPSSTSGKLQDGGGTISWGTGIEPSSGTTGTYNPPYSGTTPTQTIKTYTAQSADSWRTVYNSWRGDNTVRQGEYGGYGVHRGYWFFGSGAGTPNELVGKTIKAMKLTITRQDAGGAVGAVNAVIRHHNYGTKPTNNNPPTYSNEYIVVPFARGETKTISLPSSFFPYFQNGTAKGIGIYTENTADYMIFEPTATLEITYEG